MNLRNAWRFIHRVVSALAVLDTGIDRPAGRVVLFSCHDADRAMSNGDRRFSPLLEGIREIVMELGYTTVNLTHPYAVFRSVKIKDEAITINYRILAVRLCVLWRQLVTPNRAQGARLELEMRLYRDLLQTLSPEVVFSIQPPLAMCQAARQLGVRVAEAMHATNVSLSNRVFATHLANPDHLLPNFVLSFDDVTHATLATLCAGREIIPLKANNPWLHSLRRIQAWSYKAMRKSPDEGKGGKRILVTLQWGYDGERASLSNIIPNGILHPVLEAAFAATTGHDIHFSIRMHPIQMIKPGYRHHSRYVKSLPARYPHVECARASTMPLPLLLDEVCGHITMSSSSVGEAASANVPSLMLCPTLRRGGAHDGFFRELEGSGLVTFGELDTEAIVAWIERCAPRIGRNQSGYDAEQRHQAELRFYAAVIERAKATPVAPANGEYCQGAS